VYNVTVDGILLFFVVPLDLPIFDLGM